MTHHRYTSLIAALVCVACNKPEIQNVDTTSTTPQSVESRPTDSLLITESGIGPATLGSPLGTSGLTYERTSDGEGVALVSISIGPDTMVAYLREDEPSAPVDTTKPIWSIEAFTPGFKTDKGIHPGSLISDVEKIYGQTVRIDKSEIESREYITFANQPAYLNFRIDAGTGLFEGDSMTTTRYAPGSRIFSISIRKDP